MSNDKVSYTGAVLNENPYIQIGSGPSRGYGGSWTSSVEHSRALPEVTNDQIEARIVSLHTHESHFLLRTGLREVQVDLLNPGLKEDDNIPMEPEEFMDHRFQHNLTNALSDYFDMQAANNSSRNVVHGRYWSSFPALDVVKKRDGRTIFTPDVLGLLAAAKSHPIRNAMEREILLQADAVTVNTCYELDGMLDNYTITIRERDDLAAKTTVIPPGVSEAAFNPAQASFLKPHVRAEWGIPEDTDFVISTGGRANEGKNYEAVLYGFADYMSMLPKHEQANTYLAVAIGSSNNRQQITYVESLKQLVNELPRVVQQNIRFVGFQANPVALYAGADAYVSLSRSETFGNTVAEAMSCGRPVVVSDIPSYGDQTDYSAANLSELSIPLGEAETMGHHTAAALATVRAHKDELSMWSLERAKHFTMRQSAMKLADVVLNLTD